MGESGFGRVAGELVYGNIYGISRGSPRRPDDRATKRQPGVRTANAFEVVRQHRIYQPELEHLAELPYDLSGCEIPDSLRCKLFDLQGFCFDGKGKGPDSIRDDQRFQSPLVRRSRDYVPDLVEPGAVESDATKPSSHDPYAAQDCVLVLPGTAWQQK